LSKCSYGNHAELNYVSRVVPRGCYWSGRDKPARPSDWAALLDGRWFDHIVLVLGPVCEKRFKGLLQIMYLSGSTYHVPNEALELSEHGPAAIPEPMHFITRVEHAHTHGAAQPPRIQSRRNSAHAWNTHTSKKLSTRLKHARLEDAQHTRGARKQERTVVGNPAASSLL